MRTTAGGGLGNEGKGKKAAPATSIRRDDQEEVVLEKTEES